VAASSKESIRRKVFPKGQIVIPVALRRKYHIDIGDHVDVIPKAEGILLKPTPKREAKRSLTERLFGVFREYAKGKPKLKKADVTEATEAGFLGDRGK
jgi:AbrB family looped-hinge helix DNA binding protein